MRVTALFLVMMAALTGCRGPEGPAGPAGDLSIEVMGYVEAAFLWGSTGDVRVEISNVPGVPEAYVNDQKIPRDTYSFLYRFYESDFPIWPGDSATLRVAHTKTDGSPDISEATIRVPDRFGITSHDTSGVDTIPFAEV